MLERRIGFLINPIAGMGGRVGLKGTDGVLDEAIRRGAEPVAPGRAAEALCQLKKALDADPHAPQIEWLTCSRPMGEEALRQAGFGRVRVLHATSERPSAADTTKAVRAFLRAGAELILFCGGDGTARDVTQAAGDKTPVLGIPSGVKMYSGVFGVSPRRTADILLRYLRGGLGLARVEILDLDEDRYRQGEWAVRLTGAAMTPFEPSLTQASKLLISKAEDAQMKADIAAWLAEEIAARPGTLFLLGPGSTVQAVAEHLGVTKTLLGIDALLGGEIAGRDLCEKALLDLLERHSRAVLVLSPIGAQGFVLGRGNLQISPEVVRRIGLDGLTVIATPAKLRRTPCLRFDTGDAALDQALCARGYVSVITGYRRRRLTPLCR